MSDKDTRVFMYRGTEARLFNSPEEIPEGEGWKDAPYELEEVAAPVEKKKPSAKKAAETVAEDGNVDGN
ncbi:hypothetical protein [Hyphomicrobium sp. ghe19]|uniref:hypothetical protein n=1 Tax=Hyphomicrobium sp. ghe19 TaxID=2682968 RepID=UPI0013668354|nr:hypothetical protein HYPP_01522 [Hyphomicrobium sp. ghe19]